MIVVGPNVEAMAKTANDAAVPAFVLAKLTRTILRNIPIPHADTIDC